MRMETREIFEKLLRRMADGNPEYTAELFAPKVDFSCAGDAPWIKPRSTREDMADFFAETDGAFVPEERSAAVSGLLIDGWDAMVTGSVSQRLKSNGEAFTTPFALHLTVSEKGEITRYHVYEDSLTVAKAVAG
ncbi:MAG: nuclear transport factor 2 family protein [Rubrobacter sp.]|nr:nuclear transport factor 2 family protein [Rubrobacter sp.]